MILAGVDEAGLGPPLGPLVTARAVLETEDDIDPDAVWAKLSGSMARKPARTDSRPIVDDSKVVHAARGVAGLELTVAAFLQAAGSDRLDVAWAEEEEGDSVETAYRWHGGFLDPFPAHVAEKDVALAAEVLIGELRDAGIVIREVAARLAGPLCLNRRFSAGANKNQALLRETGKHIAHIVAVAADRPARIVVDKQGGRNDYLPFLTGLFPGTWIHTEAEGADASRYRLSPLGGWTRLSFLPRADSFSFPTALASMMAKYVRERAMAAFNRWFRERVPGLEPTAGYPQDAKRWLGEAGAFLKQAGIDRTSLVRTR